LARAAGQVEDAISVNGVTENTTLALDDSSLGVAGLDGTVAERNIALLLGVGPGSRQEALTTALAVLPVETRLVGVWGAFKGAGVHQPIIAHTGRGQARSLRLSTGGERYEEAATLSAAGSLIEANVVASPLAGSCTYTGFYHLEARHSLDALVFSDGSHSGSGQAGRALGAKGSLAGVTLVGTTGASLGNHLVKQVTWTSCTNLHVGGLGLSGDQATRAATARQAVAAGVVEVQGALSGSHSHQDAAVWLRGTGPAVAIASQSHTLVHATGSLSQCCQAIAASKSSRVSTRAVISLAAQVTLSAILCIARCTFAVIGFSCRPVARVAHTAKQHCHRVIVLGVVAGVAVSDAGTVGRLLQQSSTPEGGIPGRSSQPAEKRSQKQLTLHIELE